jgi:hypothetical protein
MENDMNSKSIPTFLGAGILIGIGITLLGLKTDQEFFNLIPTDTQTSIQALTSNTQYEQRFITGRKTITRLGIYMKPIGSVTDAASIVHVELVRDGVTIGSGDIPALSIENGGPSYVRFTEPIPTTKGELLSFRISVPSSLDDVIAVRQRVYDGLFQRTEGEFFINGVLQDAVIAYNVFEMIQPSPIRQIGGMLIAFGVYLFVRWWAKPRPNLTTLLILILIACLHALPAFDASMSYWAFAGLVTLLIIPMWAFLRISGRLSLAALFGACVFVLSTWLPLQYITGGVSESGLSIRDTLIDPNQIAISHSAGAYVGVPALIAALIGVAIVCIAIVRRQYRRYELDILVLVFGILAVAYTFIPSSISTGYGSIGVCFAVAYFASLGVSWMQEFLGKRDYIVFGILSLLCTISILDLMYVTARTFTYGLGL